MKTFKLFVALMVLGTFVSLAPAAQAQEHRGRGQQPTQQPTQQPAHQPAHQPVHQPTYTVPQRGPAYEHGDRGYQPPARVEPGRGGERGGQWERGGERGGQWERGGRGQPTIIQRHPEWRPPVRDDERWEHRDGRWVRPIDPIRRPAWGYPVPRHGYVPPYWRGPVPGINIAVTINSGRNWVYPRGCNYFGGYWFGGVWIEGSFFAYGHYRPTGIFYYPGYGWMDPVYGVYVQYPPATLETVTVVVQETVYEQVWDDYYGTWTNVPSTQTWYYNAEWNPSYGAYGYYDFHGVYHLLP